MSGKWTYRAKDQHKCLKPAYEYGVAQNDRWKCDCGKEWIVSKVNFDQRDGSWLTWRPYAVPDSDMYAPGTK